MNLTKREREVVQKILQCKTDKCIAEEMSIGMATLRTFINNIYLKYAIQNSQKEGLNPRLVLFEHFFGQNM